MAKGKKKKAKSRAPSGGAAARDPLLGGIMDAEEEGDNRRVRALCRQALADMDASPEAKEAALQMKRRLSYDPLALAFAGGGTALWTVLLFVYILARG